MAVATLPIIGTPPKEFFLALDYLPFAVLLLVLIGWQGYIVVTLLGDHVCRKYQCGKCLDCKLVQFVGNTVCVTLFPNLFKKHKQCRGSNERTFILFLDRNIENQSRLKYALHSLGFSILLVSALVFFRLFPVALSSECLEKDALLRSLFCYTNQSDFPVDCIEFATNTTREASDSSTVVCYALSTSIGLAVAAALGFAKLVAGLVTAYVRASEYWLTKEWKKEKWKKYCFFTLSIIAFAVVTGVAFAYASISIGARISNTTGELVARYAYIFLPAIAFFPFCIIVLTLETHCQQDQYSTLSPDQIPHTVGSSTPMDNVSSDGDNRNYHEF